MPYQNPGLYKKLAYWTRILATAAIVMAGIVLSGWLFDIEVLRRPVITLVAMNPLTAILFILAGTALLLMQKAREESTLSPTAVIFSGIIFIAAFIKLFGVMSGIDTGIDSMLFHSKTNMDIIGNIPNRMAPNTAFNFLLTGTALLLLNLKKNKRETLTQLIVLSILFLSILSLLGYLYKVNSFYGIHKYIPMAVHTAAGFIFMSLALLFFTPDKGIMRTFTSIYAGSTSARMMLPAAIIIPAILGYIRLLGDWGGIYSKEFGVAILILSIIIIFFILIWYNAASLNKKDAARTEAENDLKRFNAVLEQKVEDRTKKILDTEKLFRSMIENSSDIISLTDEKNEIMYINPAIEQISGYSFEEIKKLERHALLHPEDLEQAKQNFLTAINNPGTTIPVKLRIIHRNGKRVWLEGTMKNLLHDKSIMAIVSNYMDVTERLDANEKLIESENKIWRTLDKMMEGIQIIDSEWRYTYVNESIAKQGKNNRAEMLGRTMMEMYPGIENTHLFQVLRKCMTEKKPEFLENEFLHNDGSNGWFELSIQPVPEGLFILSIDITKRKNAETAIRKLNEELEERVRERTIQLEAVNKELESFSYSVSHDLRAPLRAISGYASMVVEDYAGILDEEGKRLLGVVQDNAKKMGGLIDDLLAFSRLGKKEIHKSEINIRELVEATISELNKSTEHHADIRIGNMINVKGDYSLLSQAFFNLISNAVKYSSKKEEPIVTINSEIKGQEAVFSVSDNGAGFDMKYGHKLFGVFQRLHASDEFEGTGVGLAIVQRVVSKHGGRIWAEGVVDEGATFYFTLPLTK
ncbi:MAG TPA: PAS domain S-box protein [Bacteroidia bacterium]|jgi:PAS domain S-box-containing protein